MISVYPTGLWDIHDKAQVYMPGECSQEDFEHWLRRGDQVYVDRFSRMMATQKRLSRCRDLTKDKT